MSWRRCSAVICSFGWLGEPRGGASLGSFFGGKEATAPVSRRARGAFRLKFSADGRSARIFGRSALCPAWL